MFDLKTDKKGEKRLFYTERPRLPGERGRWVEICHSESLQADYWVRVNQEFGLQVELDEHGFYRALVLKD